MQDGDRNHWQTVAWICRYTSLRPKDIDDLTPNQLRVFADKLSDILTKESGGGA
jgi:hypothetical protein